MPLTVHTHTHTCSTQGQNSLFTTWSNNVTWNTKLWVQQETERKGIIWQAQDLLSPLSSTFVIHPLYCGSHSRNTPHTHTHTKHTFNILGFFYPEAEEAEEWPYKVGQYSTRTGPLAHKILYLPVHNPYLSTGYTHTKSPNLICLLHLPW